MKNMRFFTVFFMVFVFGWCSAQTKVKGVVYHELMKTPEANVHIINLNTYKVSKTKNDGSFEIDAVYGDTLHFSSEGYHSLKMKVTNDWLKGNSVDIFIKDLSTVIDEIVVNKVKLTGFVQVDTKLLALHEYPYTKRFDATGYSIYYNTGFNPIKGIYNAVKSKSTKRLKEIQKETELIELMKTKYDRETVSAVLNLTKEEIVTTLQRCDRSEQFIYTASDFQIFNALQECLQF